MSFYLGCAVWAFKGWIGDLYPEGTRPAKFLTLYSRRFTTVEGNATFYMVPDRATIARWAAETPPGFQFCPKLPRDFTHNGLLRPSISRALQFLEDMRGLGDKLGPVFAQLPPGYGPSLLDDLTAFLAAWPRGESPLALEVRHPDWFRDPHAGALAAVMEKLGVGKVLLDSRPVYSGPADPQLHSERRKPRVPLQPVTTAPFSLVRFISHPDQESNRPFLEEWVSQLDSWLRQGMRIYFFVHCPEEERSPGTACYVQRMLEQAGAPVPPLPWNSVATPASQLRLF